MTSKKWVAYARKNDQMYLLERENAECYELLNIQRDINACLISEAISKSMFWYDQNLEKASR